MEIQELIQKLKNNRYKAKHYLEGRKLDEEFCEVLDVGFMDNSIFDELSEEDREIYALTNAEGKNKYFNRLMFPCFTYSGLFCGFIGRTIQQDIAFKYLLPSHILFSKESFIFNENRNYNKGTLFVSENIVECGRVIQCGFQAVSLNGAYKSLFKISTLPLNFNNLVFIVDNDSAGKELKNYINNILEGFTKTTIQFIKHNEKGFDEYFVKYGKEKSIKLLSEYVR